MAVSALQVWLRAQAVSWLGLGVLWLLSATERPMWWGAAAAAAMAVSFLLLASILRAGRTVADLVTLGRFALLLVVVVRGAVVVDPMLWTLAVAVVLLDLVDGAVARRFGGSPQGAVLDMEADQLTVMALAVLVSAKGGGAHVLVLPALRHVFVLAMWWVGVPAHDPKPVNSDNRRGRLVCAAVMTALLVALWPGLDGPLRDLVTLVAVLLLAWSFAGDARFLLAQRRLAKARG